MTRTEIAALRKRLRMTGDAFAAAVGLIGKNRRKTVRAWDADELKPGPQSILTDEATGCTQKAIDAKLAP